MTTGYLTQNQLIALKLFTDRTNLDTARLSDLINTDLASTFKRDMADGVKYSNAEHDILDHKNYYWVDKVKQEDLVKANNVIPHPFHKILVDQKVAYIAGNPVVVGVADEVPDSEAFQVSIVEQLDDEFDDLLNDWLGGASDKGVEWMHVYIDSKGRFEYCIVPAEQVIPIYDTQYQEELIYVIRYYTYELVNDGLSQTRYKLEWWSKTQVEYWVQNGSDKFVRDPDYAVNPAPHWTVGNTAFPEQNEPRSWGRVPFVELPNNTAWTNDLHPIKPLIDAYDRVKSGWCNDLDDFAEMVYVLKGFTGLKSESQAGLSEIALFVQNLRNDKAIAVETDGAVTTLRSEIPVEAKEKFLRITRQEIFYFGEGVDVGDPANVAQAPSGIALKFLYASLDLKANRMIRKLKTALKYFIWFVTEYINFTENKSYDAEQVTFTVNKSMVFNEKEIIDGLVASKDMLSEQTILERHPYVDDVEAEMQRLESDREKRKANAPRPPEQTDAEDSDEKNTETVEASSPSVP
jgi:SPP1 family phage portal protein